MRVTRDKVLKQTIVVSDKFSYRMNLLRCDALLILSHHLQVALDTGMEERLVQLDFLAAFHRVNYRGLL